MRSDVTGTTCAAVHAPAIAPEVLHQQLAALGASRLTPQTPDAPSRRAAEGLLQDLEEGFVEAELGRIRHLAAEAPTDADGFIEWYERMRDDGPGQWDRLFDWLAEDASYHQMRWFVRQEVVGEAGFDDLIALTQLRMPEVAKLEMARNYWDEMGRGRQNAMHGPMLSLTADWLNVDDPSLGEVVWEARALGNLLVALAANRRYAFHSVGALGAVELTAPTRTAKVAAGLKRLGVTKQASQYFVLHATRDVAHSEAWGSQVVRPLILEEPERARWIAEGLLARLNAGARCFDRYRAYFGLGGPRAQVTAPRVA